MENVPQQQKGAELSVAESLRLQISCHHEKKAHKQDQEEGEGVALVQRSGSTLEGTEAETQPHDKGHLETSVPGCYSHAQTERRGEMFLKKWMCRNLSSPPRARKGDTPDLKLQLEALGLKALEGQADI